jgi:hypothetical protein
MAAHRKSPAMTRVIETRPEKRFMLVRRFGICFVIFILSF